MLSDAFYQSKNQLGLSSGLEIKCSLLGQIHHWESIDTTVSSPKILHIDHTCEY